MVDCPKSRQKQLTLQVARRLRKERYGKGVSQQRLANYLGVTFQQVQKYENAKNRICPARLFLASQFLDIPMACFFDDYYAGEHLSPDACRIAALFDDATPATQGLVHQIFVIAPAAEQYSQKNSHSRGLEHQVTR